MPSASPFRRRCSSGPTRSSSSVLDQRGQLLRAALGFAGVPRPSYDRSRWALRSLLDSWSGIERIAVGMARQASTCNRCDERGWRATFYATGMEHSPTSATGSAWERTPWHAVQRAARDALRREDVHGQVSEQTAPAFGIGTVQQRISGFRNTKRLADHQ
jgi:hypothetical protein